MCISLQWFTIVYFFISFISFISFHKSTTTFCSMARRKVGTILNWHWFADGFPPSPPFRWNVNPLPKSITVPRGRILTFPFMKNSITSVIFTKNTCFRTLALLNTLTLSSYGLLTVSLLPCKKRSKMARLWVSISVTKLSNCT
jgi:hypothetical protein